MKAVVLEIRKNEAAVLCKDGQIVKIRRKDLTVGETIEISAAEICPDRKTVVYKQLRKYGTVAAAAAILLGFGGNHIYNTALACSYVSLDINPSIEYTLNRQDRVLDVTAVNEDAQEIVTQLKEKGVKKESLSDAITMTAELLEENGYITDGETDYILINVASDNDKKSEALKKEAQSVFDEMNAEDEENIHLTLTESTVSQRKEARDLGLSAGEYKEICSIGDKDVSKYKDMKVKELLENAGEIKTDTKDSEDKKTSDSEEKRDSAAENKAYVGSSSNKNDTKTEENTDSRQKQQRKNSQDNESGQDNQNSQDNQSSQNNQSTQDNQSSQDSQSARDAQSSQNTQNGGSQNQKGFGQDSADSQADRSNNAQQGNADGENNQRSGGSTEDNTGNRTQQNKENSKGNSGDQTGNSPVADGQNPGNEILPDSMR